MIEAIHGVINAISGFLYQPYIVPLFLVAAGLYFTVRTGFLQVRLFGESIKVVSEKPKDKRSISSFGALMVSTASRVGTGNIIGVSTAICLGGFGAIFWMWITAILGGASAFIESTLAQIYKHKDPDGTYYGGPSYYMQNALKQRWLGVIFAVILILTYVVGYNMLASFNTQDTFKTFSFYDPSKTPIIIGAILAVLFALCVLGGGKRLTNITGVLVPVMGLIYIVVSLIVVIMNITNLPLVLKNIFVAAFDFKAIFGGFAGSCMMWGIKRGLYSNEAGMGSAPNAAASADVSHPVKQGLVQMLSVFIDTLLVCTATAMMCMCANPEGLAADAAGAAYVRPDIHCRGNEPVCIHNAHRQLLLHRGLPEVHPQAHPVQGVYARLPPDSDSAGVCRRTALGRHRMGYRRYAPGVHGHHKCSRYHYHCKACSCRAQGLHEPAQRGEGSRV